MTFGKASRNVPPNARSHTSCQLQSGPRAAMISRRSAGVLPATKCSSARADVPAVEHHEHDQRETEKREPRFQPCADLRTVVRALASGPWRISRPTRYRYRRPSTK